jgi:ketosteroid isomerase-like protein
VSQENVDVVKLAAALANAGDWDGVFALYHPDVEYRDLRQVPDMPEVLHGLSGVRRVGALWTDIYDEFRPEVYEYIDADPWVVCDTRWFGTSKDSDVPVDIHEADAYEVKDGKIVRAIMGYLDVEAALKAVGLED